MFLLRSSRSPIVPPCATRHLRLATWEELTQSHSFALRFYARNRVHDADKVMPPITAERLAEHLERSGHVVMQKPSLRQHEAPGNLVRWIEKAARVDRGGSSATVFLGALTFRLTAHVLNVPSVAGRGGYWDRRNM
jgi:hypothetical protein